MHQESDFWMLWIGYKSEKQQWCHNLLTWHQGFFVSLVNFSYWSKFHVNIISGSGTMTVFFDKRLTRNPEIGNTSVWVLPNIWRLGQVRNTKFGTNVSNKILLDTAKCQGYSFYHFWFIKGKPTECNIIPLPPPTQTRVNDLIYYNINGNKMI